jgi:hypothetical protein
MSAEPPDAPIPASNAPQPTRRAPSAQRPSHAAGSQLEAVVHWGIWALVLWAVLLFFGTLTHQPDPTTDVPAYARYITTPEFEMSHLVASIWGAAMGSIGFTALFLMLGGGRIASLALWGFIAAVVGNTVITSIFGAAAFAQPAIGRAYLAGHTAEAIAINQDVYGPALLATALPGLLLLVIGLVLLGAAVARSGSLPQLAGIGLAVGGVVFALIGFILSDFVQSIGAVLLVASAAWIAWVRWQRPGAAA